ncbi:MAG: hypothetical protein RLZZ400_209 [Actinomycetota bacterium]|jgi:hypothetical protein
MNDNERNRNHRDRARDDQRPERPSWQQRVDRQVDRPKSPLIPEEITAEDLAFDVRVQLKTLSADNASMTARHLAMAGLLFDQDPELAHAHAVAAFNRAGRIAVVRETVAITAYQVEDWAMCLRELLAHRRMTGSNQHIAMMVDCERGLGRPQKGLDLGRSVDRSTLEPEARVQLAIAMSGARLDLGENERALAELEIRELDPTRVFDYSAQLFYAYADTLEVLGRADEAKHWMDLAERAERAVQPQLKPEDEQFTLIEEIRIPIASGRPKRDGGRPKRDGGRPKRDGDRPKRDGERPKRDGDRPQRDPKSFKQRGRGDVR